MEGYITARCVMFALKGMTIIAFGLGNASALETSNISTSGSAGHSPL